MVSRLVAVRKTLTSGSAGSVNEPSHLPSSDMTFGASRLVYRALTTDDSDFIASVPAYRHMGLLIHCWSVQQGRLFSVPV